MLLVRENYNPQDFLQSLQLIASGHAPLRPTNEPWVVGEAARLRDSFWRWTLAQDPEYVFHLGGVSLSTTLATSPEGGVRDTLAGIIKGINKLRALLPPPIAKILDLDYEQSLRIQRARDRRRLACVGLLPGERYRGCGYRQDGEFSAEERYIINVDRDQLELRTYPHMSGGDKYFFDYVYNDNGNCEAALRCLYNIRGATARGVMAINSNDLDFSISMPVILSGCRTNPLTIVHPLSALPHMMVRELELLPVMDFNLLFFIHIMSIRLTVPRFVTGIKYLQQGVDVVSTLRNYLRVHMYSTYGTNGGSKLKDAVDRALAILTPEATETERVDIQLEELL
jgi:hypothetical protein